MSNPCIPELPERNTPWSLNVHDAYHVISTVFAHAAQALESERESDPLRLRFHREALTNDALPLLVALESHSEEEGVSTTWLHSCAERIGTLLARLQDAEVAMDERFIATILAYKII